MESKAGEEQAAELGHHKRVRGHVTVDNIEVAQCVYLLLQELAEIVPDLPSVPVQPLLLEGSGEYGMFEHFKRYPWVLETYTYASSTHLIAGLGEHVIGPAEDYARSVRGATPQTGAHATGSG